MELIEAIKSRKSIRGYKSTPVPKEILAEILEIATRAPSSLNTQPWEFTVLGGGVLDDLKNALEQQFLARAEPYPDFRPESLMPLTGIYRRRQVELAIELYQLLGISREDKEKRDQWMLKQLRAFDAPNVIIVSLDEAISSSPIAMFNLGAVTQTIALLAVNFGLGTCIQGALVYYPDIVRRITGIPQSKKLATGIAIGYPDWDFPANKLQSTREPLANIVTWRGI
ncbi:MAG TPA: nitroreductase [Dehalococcoidia bacterium]|nr:nitroreductase [Dehalococcoidia bacterium]